MIITVGSKNPAKLEAVKEIIEEYDFLKGAEVIIMEVPVDLYGHPKTLEDTTKGALQRAKDAFVDCDYSFGIESGLMVMPYSKSGFMETTVCAIYDGKNHHLGLATAFEYPKIMMEQILNKGLDASQAVKKVGLTDHPKLGAERGIIHMLTKGRLTRKEQAKQSIMMALIHLENPNLY
ncbi:MAG: inosine/xanthosine triphosphatase [Candidatus Doudnabacteria bacterium]|nr:inosine/xanthosine triphosphatase [Candidatus Doudnabacteria bacterium]